MSYHLFGEQGGEGFQLQEMTSQPTNPVQGKTRHYPVTDGFYVRRSDGTVERLNMAERITPPQITADQNNYNPGTAPVWRLSSDAARNITGIAAPSPEMPRWLFLVNVGAFNIVLKNQDVASQAANRIITGTGADLTIGPDARATLWYDPDSDRWRVW